MNNDDINYDDVISKDIFDLVNASNLPEEKKKELYQKMIDVVNARTARFIADRLTDDNLNKWKQLKTPAEKTKFLQDSGIDVNRIMTQQALIYKTELIDLIKIAQGKKG